MEGLHGVVKVQPSKWKKVKEFKSELNTLRFAQEVQVSTEPIWVVRFSPTNQFIATGGSDSILRIYEVLDPKTTHDVYTLIDKPFWKYNVHKRDIVDISWSPLNPFIIASVSHDKATILWDIRDIKPLYIFIMPSVVTGISFCPGNEDFIATGSIDKITRIWSIKHKTVVDWVEIKDVISSVSYSLDGERLVVGTLKGLIMVFDTTSKLM